MARHDIGVSFRQALPVLIAGFLVFVALVPISTTAIPGASILNIEYTHRQLKYQLFAPTLSWAVLAASVIYGVVLALVLFHFLQSQRATTAFFSLALSRIRLFTARYLTGIVCLIVGIGVPFLISFLLNRMALGGYPGDLIQSLYVFCGYLLTAAIAFSIVTFSTIFAGTLAEATVFLAALLAGVSVILWGCDVIARYLLVGDPVGVAMYGQSATVAPPLIESLSWCNPLLFFLEEGASHQWFTAYYPNYFPLDCSWMLLLGWTGILMLFSCIDCWRFCRRKAEQAETAGMAPGLSLFSVAVFGLALFTAATSLIAPTDIPVAIVVGLALFLLLSLVLLFGPLRGFTTWQRTIVSVTSELVVMGAAILIIWTGLFGYANYIPAADDIESLQISYNGSPSYLTSSFKGTSSGASYYCTSDCTYTSDTAIALVRKVHGELIGTARSARSTDQDDFLSTVVPYDVAIRYTLDDGRECVRYFKQATVGELAELLALDDDDRSHELQSAVITGDVSELSDDDRTSVMASPSYKIYQKGAIYVSDGVLNTIVGVSCTDEDRTALLDAIASDYASIPAEKRYMPSTATRYVIMFTNSPSVDVASFAYSFGDALVYVDDDYTQTLAWLDDHGVGDSLGTDVDPRVIEELKIQPDDPYTSKNAVQMPESRFFMAYRTTTPDSYWVTKDFGASAVIDDPTQIAALLPCLRTGCYMTGGYLVQAKLSGIEAYVYLYLPAQAVPDSLQGAL